VVEGFGRIMKSLLSSRDVSTLLAKWHGCIIVLVQIQIIMYNHHVLTWKFPNPFPLKTPCYAPSTM
jgi:dethiobiotin synthetase